MSTPMHETDDRSIGDLVGEATSELSLLLRKEVELAKLEVKQEIRDGAESAKWLGIGAFCGYLAVLLLAFAASWALAEVMPAALGFLIVAVVLGIAAAITLKTGRERLERVDPVPENTVETLKEDVQWLKARKNGR
jgi:hypothetical protein